MFAKKFRLPATVSLSHAQVLFSPFFTVKVQKNELPYNRYGFVIGKKISKRAHVRNRTKRRVRACVETLHSQLESGHDILFILKSAAVVIETEKLHNEVHSVLGKARLVLVN